MIKKITISSLLILTIFINSCSVGYSVDRTFTPLITLNCETMPENVALFFEGEKIDFEYEKIGLIEIQGQYSSTDAELIEEVKKMAKSKCCDIVINLKKSYVDRDKKLLFTDVPDEKYTSIVYNGIAVRKKSNISN
jgi:hypothetical protein